MTLITQAGTTLHREILERRGSTENPVSQTAIEEKFRANVRRCLSGEETGDVMALVARFDSTAALTNFLARVTL